MQRAPALPRGFCTRTRLLGEARRSKVKQDARRCGCHGSEQPAAPQQALHGKLALHLHVMARHMKEEGAATAEATHKQVVAAATQSKQEAIMAAHAMDDAQSKQVAIYHAEQQHKQVALEKPEEREEPGVGAGRGAGQ